MNRSIVLAYATNKGLQMMTREDARMLTHINLAFGVIKDGLLDMRGLPDIGLIEEVRAWNPEIRIVLSIGGWGAGGFSTMAMTDETRRAFVGSVARGMDQHRLDGVDIDWEYPCNGSAEIDFDRRDRENFTLLLSDLRAMAGDRIVSIAAGAGEYFIRDTEMDKVAAICDYVQLMTYDMRSGFCKQAGHHTSLYPSAGDGDAIGTHQAVEMFRRAGVPANKIVIGAAFYSRMWTGVPDVNGGLLQQAESTGLFGPTYGKIARECTAEQGYVKQWDEDAQAAYIYKDGVFLSFDDPKSIRTKCEYLIREGLLGIMYWEHSCDDTRALLRAIHEACAR